ncbi:MAG: ThiF family adenylyltransferase [Pirellulales bacterium]
MTTPSIELVIPRVAYDSAIRQQWRDPESYAIGRFRWHETIEGRQILVEQLDSVPGLPSGDRRPPLDCYLVLRLVSSNPPAETAGATTTRLIETIRPLRSHHVVALVIHSGPPASWHATLRMPDGKCLPVTSLTVQGPAPLHLEHQSGQSAHVTEEDADRWSRTAGALGTETFEKIRRSRVQVIGAGRNGSLCASLLAALGVAHLRLIDGDSLESHNLIGTIGLDSADVGRGKVEAVAKSISRSRPELPLVCWNKSLLAADVLADLRRHPVDLLVTCVDDDAARLAAWLLAHSLLIPYLDIASAVMRDNLTPTLLGDARLFAPGVQTGCPVCVGGVSNLEDTLYAINAPEGALRRGAPVHWSDQRAGSLVTLNATIVGAALQLWLDYLGGHCTTSAWQRIQWASGSGLLSHWAAVASTADCRMCRTPSSP